MSPNDWYFCYFEACLAREKQELWIKAPTINSLEREERLCGASAKSLESALRVLKIQAQ